MLGFYIFHMYRWLNAIFLCIGLLVILYILFTYHESGDQPWIWVPFIILLPILGLIAYVIYKLIRASGDRRRAVEQYKASQNRGSYVSRRVKSEKELRDGYYQGRIRR